MTYIRLAANDQKLNIAEGPKLASGDQNSVFLRLVFSGHWAGYEKSAVFFTSWDKTVYEVILEDNECVVPHEVLRIGGELYIGVRGVDPNTMAVKTSTLVKYRIDKGAPVGDATSVDPTPDVYQQILAKLDDIQSGEVDEAKVRAIVVEYLANNPETDPTVPAWAKKPEKPSYTASEVGAQPAGDYVEKSDIASGVQMTDRTTGEKYKLYVDNGKLTMEVV